MDREASSSHRFVVEPKSTDHFAWIRTRLALDRTMMAWARTSIAMIGFGFTIVKFFESLASFKDVSPALIPSAPRYVGLLLIGTGTCALGVSVWQYFAIVRYLWSPDFRPIAGAESIPKISPVLWVVVLLIVIGLFSLGSILIRVP